MAGIRLVGDFQLVAGLVACVTNRGPNAKTSTSRKDKFPPGSVAHEMD
jgi:hypothetical protein